ncbi:MAG: ribosome recycling factor, partial [Alphaproteobacteria bacterium]|nr:ribosome recycling factor [Alphaproteobacteria bacterium]
MADPDISDLKRRMDGALSVLRSEFASLRTGRASANLLDRVVVPAYDGEMPITQVATVNVPEPRLLTVNV